MESFDREADALSNARQQTSQLQDQIAANERQAKLDTDNSANASDDAEVQQSGARQGGKTGSAGQLTRHLNAAPPALARLSRHRQQARRQYGLNPAQKYEDDDYEEYEEYEPPRSPRRKKKKASRHHS